MFRSQIDLTADELLTAHRVALARQEDNVRKHRPAAYGAPDNRGNWDAALELDEQGAQAELAFLKMTGMAHSEWQAVVDTIDLRSIPGDVGAIQVRSTKHRSGCLILHPSDPDRACFVLLLNESPTFRFAGWLWGAEGKQSWWWREDVRHPAYFVPQGRLRKRVSVDPHTRQRHPSAAGLQDSVRGAQRAAVPRL